MDPILGKASAATTVDVAGPEQPQQPQVYVLWGHLDVDGVTILGLVDWYCVGVMRRRWMGWKLAELSVHLATNKADLDRHLAWRAADI